MRANSMRPLLILDLPFFGYRENPLNLAIFQLLQVAQDDGFTQFGRELCERRLHLAAQLAEKRLLVRALRGRLLFSTTAIASSSESVARSRLVRR